MKSRYFLLTVLVAVYSCKAPPVNTPAKADVLDDGATLADSSGKDESDGTTTDGGGPSADIDATVDTLLEVDATTDTADDAGDSDVSVPVDVADIGATPTDHCATLSLPKPGDVCSEEGAVNCTNAGATSEFKNQAYNHGYCRRPNRVVCTKSANGLTWQMEACPIPPSECTDAGQIVTCQINERGAKCCPLRFMAGPSTSFGEVCSEAPKDLAAKWCEMDLKQCSFPDQWMSTFPADIQASGAAALAKCLPWCKDCVYGMGIVQFCPSMSMATCGFAFQPIEKSTQAQKNCFPEGLPGKPGPACVETCEEYKQTQWYKDWYK